MTTPAPYIEALERALGSILAEFQARSEVQAARSEAVIARLEASNAELQAQNAELRARHEMIEAEVAATVREGIESGVRDIASGVVERLDGVADRATVDAALADVREEVGRLTERQAGAMDALDELRGAVADDLERAISELPEPRDWQPEIDAVAQRAERMVSDVADAVEDARRRVAEHPGTFPQVRSFAEGEVHYEGALAVFEGATWQATRDTARQPPHEDWRCVAAAGRDGRDGSDGRSPDPRGTYAEGETYERLDVVAMNGGSFIALRDNPGPCPGEGWQLLAGRGKPGKPGEKGEGVRGDPGPPLVAAELSDEGMLTLTNGDGSTVEADFYPVLRKVAK